MADITWHTSTIVYEKKRRKPPAYYDIAEQSHRRRVRYKWMALLHLNLSHASLYGTHSKSTRMMRYRDFAPHDAHCNDSLKIFVPNTWFTFTLSLRYIWVTKVSRYLIRQFYIWLSALSHDRRRARYQHYYYHIGPIYYDRGRRKSAATYALWGRLFSTILWDESNGFDFKHLCFRRRCTMRHRAFIVDSPHFKQFRQSLAPLRVYRCRDNALSWKHAII